MLDAPERTAPPRSFWIIAILALLWNLMGVATYLMSVTQSPDALAAMSEAERALYTDVPDWVTSAYAIAVFGGTLASIALLMRRGWAVPLFGVSLIGILVQMTHAFFLSGMIAVLGVGSVIVPILVIVIAVFLVSYARSARARGWIG